MNKSTKQFIKSYLMCALWSSCGNPDDQDVGEPLDADYNLSDIELSTIKRVIVDCTKFIAAMGSKGLTDHEDFVSYEQAGHDFWLTRNGHGAGFWDGDWKGIGKELTKLAKGFGQVDPIVTDDNKIQFV